MVSKSDDFDFLEIESINFLDSKPVFGFRGSFVFSKEISIVFGNDANFRFSVYLDLNLEVLEELSLGQPKEFDLRIGVLLDLDSDSCDLEVSFSLEDNCLLINPVFPPNGESINLGGVIELDFNFVSSNLFVKLNGQNVNLVVGINFEVGNGDVDLVVDLNFESGNLFSGPIFPVPNLVFMIVLPVFGDGFDFKSIVSLEFFNSEFESDIELVSNDSDFSFHFGLKVQDNDLSIFMKSKSPLFNKKSNIVIVFFLFQLNEYLDHVIEFSGDFSDSEFVISLGGNSPFLKGDDPFLFFIVHKFFVFCFD